MTYANIPMSIPTEDAIKEMWSMLGYFESESNAGEYLKRKFPKIEKGNLDETRASMAFTMKAAREFYNAAENVTILTEPLLLFYGMTALSKVVFTATHGKASPSTSHGLQFIDGGSLSEYSARVTSDGTFPQFHGCLSKENLDNVAFSVGELLSLVPEIKESYETIYRRKSNSYRVERHRYGISVVSDTALSKEEVERIERIPGLTERYPSAQLLNKDCTLHLMGLAKNGEIPRQEPCLARSI